MLWYAGPVRTPWVQYGNSVRWRRRGDDQRMLAKRGAASGKGVSASLRAGVSHSGLIGGSGIMQLEAWCTERRVKQSWVFKSLGTL